MSEKINLFNNLNEKLKDTYPFSDLCVVVVNASTGKIVHKYKPWTDNIDLVNEFRYDKSIHDLALFIPRFYAKREFKDGKLIDRILNIVPKSSIYGEYSVHPLFMNGVPYFCISLYKLGFYNGFLRSIPGIDPAIVPLNTAYDMINIPDSNGVSTGGQLFAYDAFFTIQVLLKFLIRNSKTSDILGPPPSKTRVSGSSLDSTDAISTTNQFVSGGAPIALNKVFTVVGNRLRFLNKEFVPVRISNNKTLDECIVEETDDYVIYSDGIITADDPIPEPIHFACYLNKLDKTIYIGDGYQNGAQKYKYGISDTSIDENGYLVFSGESSGGYFYNNYGNDVPEYLRVLTGKTFSISIEDMDDPEERIEQISSLSTGKYSVQYSDESTAVLTAKVDYPIVDIVFKKNENRKHRMKCMLLTSNIQKPFVKTKCPNCKIEVLEEYYNDFIVDGVSLESLKHFKNVVEHGSSGSSLTSSSELFIQPYVKRLNQNFLDKFSEEGVYPFNLIGRYLVNKDSGLIISRLGMNNSSEDYFGNKITIDPEVHDVYVLFFPFYCKRDWKGFIMKDSMLFQKPTSVNLGNYSVPPIFQDNGKVRPYIMIGAFEGSIVNNQLRSLPFMQVAANKDLSEFRNAARFGRNNKFNILTIDAISMLQFMFLQAFKDTDSQKIIGLGVTKYPSSTYPARRTGETMSIGNRSGEAYDPYYAGADRPNASILGALTVVNGRLQYRSDGVPCPLAINNNKTLDECIVEETDDYVIYSDGDRTPADPIPEPNEFACRVDKHTGEIYYGEGYRILGPVSILGGYGYLTREIIEENDKYIKCRMTGTVVNYKGVTMLTQVVRPNDSSQLIDSLIVEIRITVKGEVRTNFSIYSTNTSTADGIYYHHEATVLNDGFVRVKVATTWSPEGGQTARNWCVGRFHSLVEGQVLSGDDLIVEVRKNKSSYTETTYPKPYVKTKCPVGKITWRSSNEMTLDKYSYLIKDLVLTPRLGVNKGNPISVTRFNSAYICDTPSGECTCAISHAVAPNTSFTVGKGDVYITNTDVRFTSERNNVYSEGVSPAYNRHTVFLRPPLGEDISRYVSCKGFYIYKGVMNPNTCSEEINKDIKAVSNSVIDSSLNEPINLFGLENIYGNYYEWVDGVKYRNNIGLLRTLNYSKFGLENEYEINTNIMLPSRIAGKDHGYVKSIYSTHAISSLISIPSAISNTINESNFKDSVNLPLEGEDATLLFGGCVGNADLCGLFRFYFGWSNSSFKSWVTTARLLYLPDGI